MAGDPSLEKFRSEYEKVHRAQKKSHEGEKRLVKKCRELNAELVANAAKVQTALKLSEEDQSTIAALKKEIEKAWKMVDASHDKEARAKETIQQLKLETSNLSKLVEQGAGMNLGLGVGSESTLNDLLKEKEGLVRERDDQVNQIVVLRNEVMEVQEKLRVAETERLNLEVEVGGLRDSVESKRAEGVREQRKMDHLDRGSRSSRRPWRRSRRTSSRRRPSSSRARATWSRWSSSSGRAARTRTRSRASSTR